MDVHAQRRAGRIRRKEGVRDRQVRAAAVVLDDRRTDLRTVREEERRRAGADGVHAQREIRQLEAGAFAARERDVALGDIEAELAGRRRRGRGCAKSARPSAVRETPAGRSSG